MKNSYSKAAILTAVAASVAIPLLARAGTSTNTVGPVQQGQSDGGAGNPSLNNSAITISLAGQTALRGFTASAAPTLLQPGASIVLHDGTNGAPVTYYASNNGATSVQLAAKDFTLANTGVGATNLASAPTIQSHSAIRLEWQEKGSLDGFYDFINDQIGYTPAAGPVSILAGRGPSVSNPVWVNQNSFTTGATINGHTLNGGTGAAFYNTYANNSSFGANQVYDAATGTNLLGGQNRVQVAIGEYSTENFAYSGTASPFAKPGQAGYGLGNPALNTTSLISGLGNANSRQQFNPTSVANQSADKVDPQSPTGQTYAAGPWNSAGAGNIDSQQVAVTAVTISANPGTGLERLNLSDTQWIQTAGRLQNGADFNDVSRVANTGQRNVLAINTGVDPTWAVGENDGGDTTASSAATAQSSIGPNLKFSGKTSGTFSRNAIAQSRMGIGALSLAEARGANAKAPVRALDIDFNDLTDPVDGSGNTDQSKFLRLNFDNFVNFKYKAILISQYNTVKAPNPAYANLTVDQWNALSSAQTGIKGDTTGDVQAFISNIVNSEATFSTSGPPSSVGNPSDGLLANGFFSPSLMNFKRQTDGGALTPNVLSQSQLDLQSNIASNYPTIFTVEGSFGSNAQTIGGSGSYYGFTGVDSPINGGTNTVAFTAKNADGSAAANGVTAPKGNWLFGNFNQDGRRDYASVIESLNAALSLHHTDGANNSIFTADGGVSNATVVTPLNSSGAATWGTTATTKGDLIILGDYNGDGRFDGRDVLLLARGASLADSVNSDHLTAASGATFSDAVRNPNAVLRKNAALDYIQANTANINDADQTFIRKTAETPQAQANDAANHYLNAFNKFDVDHNGKLDRNDAAIVDKFIGKDYKNLSDQLTATINDPYANTNQRVTSGTQYTFSLVDANLTDGKSVIDRTDFALVRAAVGSKLTDGDADFDGSVGFSDLVVVAQNYGLATGDARWDQGDFTGDGDVGFDDLVKLAQNYGGGPLTAPIPGASAGFQADLAAAFASVPEPSSFIVLLAGAAGLMRPRSRRR